MFELGFIPVFKNPNSEFLKRNLIKSVFSKVGIFKKSKLYMKKRTVFISAILSLIPLGQPLLIKTGLAISTTGLMLSVPEKVNAENANFYFQRGFEKGKKGDYYGAISDFTKAIEINPKDWSSYYNRA